MSIHCVELPFLLPLKEFRAIGIEKQGFVLRLEKAAKKLPTMVIETEVPVRDMHKHACFVIEFVESRP